MGQIVTRPVSNICGVGIARADKCGPRCMNALGHLLKRWADIAKQKAGERGMQVIPHKWQLNPVTGAKLFTKGRRNPVKAIHPDRRPLPDERLRLAKGWN